MNALIWLAPALLTAQVLQSPPPSPAPTPASPQNGLQIDIEKHVDRAIEKGMLRFETRVDVEAKTPQELLQELLRGFDLECGAPQRGAPTDAETRAHMQSQRPTTPYQVDFVPLLAALNRKLAGKKPTRYYIYRVARAGGQSFSIRDRTISMERIYNTPGVSYELVAEAPDLQSATDAFWRLERGLSAKAADSSQPAPWLNWNCRAR